MPEVLLIIPGTSYGGAHNQAATLAAPLAEHGYSTSVVLPREPGDALDRLRGAGQRVSTMRLRRLRAGRPVNNVLLLLGLPLQVARLRRAVRRAGADVVQVHGIQQVDAALAARLAGAAVVWQLLDTRAPRPLMAALRAPLRRLADAVLVTGRNTADAHGLTVGEGDVVSFYPPVPDAAASTPPAAVREVLGVPADAVLVGTLANLNPQKGHENLLRAFALLRSRSADGAVLRVRGGLSAGHEAYRDQLLALGRDVDPRARVVGTLEPELAPRDFIGALDVLVLPSVSRSEGLPTVIIEAMKAGVCVVASAVGGVPEMIESGVDGLVVTPGSPEELAAALEQLLARPELRRELAARGRASAEARYSLQGTVDSYLTAYTTAQERAAARRARDERRRAPAGPAKEA